MSEIEKYDDSDHILDTMDAVAKRLMAGKNELAIARELKMKRIEVIKYRDLWRERLAADMESRDAARDQLNQMVSHFDRLIEKSYSVYRSLESMSFDEKIAAQMNTTLKNIADYEDKRVKALRESGLLDGAALGDQLAKMEEKQQILIQILRDDLCPTCRIKVMTKLKRVTGQVEAVDVVESVVVEDDQP